VSRKTRKDEKIHSNAVCVQKEEKMTRKSIAVMLTSRKTRKDKKNA